MSNLATHFLAPASLSLVPGEEVNAPRELSELEPGDIVLLRTPGVVYQSFRQVSNYSYDHVVVALSRPDHCLHISPPKARRVRTNQLLIEERDPLVLRPQIAEKERHAFIARCESLLGTDYNLTRLYGTLFRTIAEKQFKVGRFLPRAPTPKASDQAWLCTDAVLICLLESSIDIQRESAKFNPPLDFVRTGSASMDDILRLRANNFLHDVPVLLKNRTTPVSTAERLKQAWDEASKQKVSLRTVGFALLLSSLFNRRIFILRMIMLLAVLIVTASNFNQVSKLASKI